MAPPEDPPGTPPYQHRLFAPSAPAPPVVNLLHVCRHDHWNNKRGNSSHRSSRPLTTFGMPRATPEDWVTASVITGEGPGARPRTPTAEELAAVEQKRAEQLYRSQYFEMFLDADKMTDGYHPGVWRGTKKFFSRVFKSFKKSESNDAEKPMHPKLQPGQRLRECKD